MYSYVPFDKNMDSAIVIGRGAYANAGTKYEIVPPTTVIPALAVSVVNKEVAPVNFQVLEPPA